MTTTRSSLPRAVVDASIVIKWHLRDEEHDHEANTLLTDYREGRIDLVAPLQLHYEVANAVRVAALRGRIDAEEGRSALIEFFSWDIPTLGGRWLVLAGYQAALQFGCAFYDGLYVALAEQAECPLVHADNRLRNTLQGRFAHELWIQDYPPTS